MRKREEEREREIKGIKRNEREKKKICAKEWKPLNIGLCV